MSVMTMPSYIIRGGQAGRERLRLLARVMRPTTAALFERAGVREGMRCLDVGCGAATCRSIWRASSARGAAWSGSISTR